MNHILSRILKAAFICVKVSLCCTYTFSKHCHFTLKEFWVETCSQCSCNRVTSTWSIDFITALITLHVHHVGLFFLVLECNWLFIRSEFMIIFLRPWKWVCSFTAFNQGRRFKLVILGDSEGERNHYVRWLIYRFSTNCIKPNHFLGKHASFTVGYWEVL